MKLALKKIGNSTGLILPRDLLQELGMSQGDSLTLTREADDSIRLSKRDVDFDEGLEIARKMMRRYDSALKELAK